MTGYEKAWKKHSFCVVKAMLSGCKSYRFSSWKLSNDTVKAMLSRKKRWKMMIFALSKGHFPPGLRFFVDKNKKAKSPKCPILCTYVITPFIIVSKSCLLWLLLFVKRLLWSWHEVEYCFLQGVILRKIFLFRYLGDVFVFVLQKQFITLCVSILYLLN